MPLPSEIQIVPLDFNVIRADLKRFLQSQTLLKDYNYEGSVLSTLIDLLAYDAYYHGWYTNFAVNEVFLQTAQIRNSIVAAARQVGYVPRSVSSAVGIVDIAVAGIDTTEAVIELPRYVKFTSNTGGDVRTFYTVNATSIQTFAESTVTFTGIEIYEGVKLAQQFTIAPSDIQSSGVRLTLPNETIDTRTLTISVKPEPNSSTSFIYEKATTAVTISPTSNVFFLFENNDGTYDIQFGDGQLGRNLSAGQQVIADYLISSGALGNGANTFNFSDSLSKLVTTTTGVTVSVGLNNINIPSYGGADRESNDSIKKNAPAIYQVQGRIVTPEDARTVLLTEYGSIQSVSIWSGEDNDPPTYGKMFIALKPFNGEKFGLVQKDNIVDKILRPKALPTLAFEFVDPDYIYIPIQIEAKYTPALTSRNTSELADIIADTVTQYAETTLGQFGSVFRYSQISKLIDSAEQSIQSNISAVKLEKRFRVVTSSGSYTLDFANPLFVSTVDNQIVTLTSRVGSQRFSHEDRTGTIRQGCYLENSGSVINIYRDEPSEGKILVKSNVGSINFASGKVTFTTLYPSAITTNYIGELRVQAIPNTSDIIARRSQIIRIPLESVNVRVVPDLLDRQETTTGRVVNGAIVF